MTASKSDLAARRQAAIHNLFRPRARRSGGGVAASADSPGDPLEVEEDDRAFKPLGLSLSPLCVRTNVAAQMIGVGKTKLYELISEGELETLKMGKSTLVTVASLQALVARRLEATIR